ncbi:glutaryl-7-aminocephalosporanic-acid acylase [Candidatus Phycosocius bacilliformis]|uniref:Glutaryl-7-aminocephalosporanic-acid acylase n=1 Tax=Candidatus Phycosocius bacilliformis TaxID=1445552 RepID=A0A2P2EB21_9PROT|nr:acylase [Candidatus Phycosocius bacilliformis]GBF58255.1 glutaryl-7-aminocephalosporanic-acid acylase [Candidatus Phycosocius bacilliformis]
MTKSTRISLLIGLIILCLGLGAYAAGVRLALGQERIDPAPYLAKAQTYQVEIARDTFGVPHIFGPRDADVAFGMGYAHSEDDFATIADAVLTSRGTAAAIKGKDAAVGDYLVALMDVWPRVRAGYATEISPQARAVMEAYADGVNLYAAQNPAKVPNGLLPLTGQDVAAGIMFRSPFFYGLDKVLKSVLEPEAATKPNPDKTPPKGSNGVAVAPKRTDDGATRLLVNSHQPYDGMVAWYEAVLESGQGWHVAGGFFPGSPFMLHGHNANLGWASTVNKPDLVDVYKLTTDPAHPGQYLMDGKWLAFRTGTARFQVKLFGPLLWTVKRDLLWSVHGPVLVTKQGHFAISYAGQGELRQADQYLAMNKAADFDQWRAAMARQALPSINFIYADRAGTIGYLSNGQFPIRKDGVDWAGILPGDRSDLVWKQRVGFDQLPQMWNPQSGLVFNANNDPRVATDGPDNMRDAAMGAHLGLQTNMTNRAYRALETYGQDPIITEADFEAYKYDLTYSDKSLMAGLVAQALAFDATGNPDLAAAQKILKAWDRRTDTANRGAALAVLMSQDIGRAAENGEPAPPLRPGLDQAITTLKTHFGRLDPTWGEVNRYRRGTLNLPIDGGPDILRAVYGKDHGDGTLTATAGDTFIMFVTWDSQGRLSSRSIHQYGSATLDATSPHYGDQGPLFTAMKTKPVLFTRAQLAGQITKSYRPGR